MKSVHYNRFHYKCTYTYTYLTGFSGVHVARSPVVCVMFCRSLFVLLSFFSFGHCVVCSLLLVIVLSVRFTDSDYPFDIFKLFLRTNHFGSLCLPLLPNTDHLQQIDNYVRGCTSQLSKSKTIYKFHKLVFN